MRIISDLHIHGRYSQATSESLSIENLEKYARMKGIGLLGTGDFTHPKWIVELKDNLIEDGTGFLRTKSGFPFVLQSEISLVYSQGGKGRRVHVVILAPDFVTVKKITDYLLTKGRIDYDGRPIFKIPCNEFVRELRRINERIEVIPAHIWTPWFSMFGSRSGFDTIKDCFLEETKHIHAIETGLSSDPAMNWRLSQLDGLQILSFSDLHSFWPWRIGREATIFDIPLDYDSLLKAIRTGNGLVGTIEVDPNYGKYHYDGHRNCNIVFSPEESKQHHGVCPICKSPLTIGVQYRVEELADRPEGSKPEGTKPYYSLVPLSELIAAELETAVASKAVWAEYHKILGKESEYEVVLDMHKQELLKRTSAAMVDLILKNREGTLRILPGYDGVYGQLVLEGKTPKKEKATTLIPKKAQTGLSDFF